MSHALLLSAGLGTRLRPYTDILPKPAIPFFNIPMAGFSFYYAKLSGVSHFHINTHHLPQAVKSAYQNLSSPETTLSFFHENTLMGSGGALWGFKETLGSQNSFLLVNSDSIFLSPSKNELSELAKSHKNSEALASVLLMPFPDDNTDRSACWVDDNSQVVTFGTSCSHPTARPFHYCGAMALSSRAYNYLPEGASNILYDVLLPAKQRGEKINALISPSLFWHETGNIKDYFKATDYLVTQLDTNSPLGQELFLVLKSFHNDMEIKTTPSNALVIGSKDLLKNLDSNKLNFKNYFIAGNNVSVSGSGILDRVIVNEGVRLELKETLAHELILK